MTNKLYKYELTVGELAEESPYAIYHKEIFTPEQFVGMYNEALKSMLPVGADDYHGQHEEQVHVVGYMVVNFGFIEIDKVVEINFGGETLGEIKVEEAKSDSRIWYNERLLSEQK